MKWDANGHMVIRDGGLVSIDYLSWTRRKMPLIEVCNPKTMNWSQFYKEGKWT